MTYLENFGIALDRIYGITLKPACPICGRRIPQPHMHCDGCDNPFEVMQCGQEGCRARFCIDCMKKHRRHHIYDNR